MSNKDYKDYLTDKNEIAEWVHGILNEKELSGRLRKAKDKVVAVRFIEKRINSLKSATQTIKTTRARGRSRSTKPKSRKRYAKSKPKAKQDSVTAASPLESEIESLPELPEMQDVLQIPEAVQRMPITGIDNATIMPKKRRLLPFFRFRARKQEIENAVAAGPLDVTVLEEHPTQKVTAHSISLPEIPQLTGEAKLDSKLNSKKLSTKKSLKPELTQLKISDALEPASLPWEDSLPALPDEDDEKMPVPEITVQDLKSAAETETVKKEPKRFLPFLLFGKREAKDKGLDKLGSAAEDLKVSTASSQSLDSTGTAVETGGIPDVDLSSAPDTADAIEVSEEPSSSETGHEKGLVEEAVGENVAGEDVTGEDVVLPKPKLTDLDLQAQQLEKMERLLNDEEEELNRQRLELTRRRYESIKQKGEIERMRFEEFVDRHKLEPSKEVVHGVSEFPAPESSAVIKGIPDFRLAEAYGRGRLEELLDEAKRLLRENNAQAAQKVLDEVLSVVKTVYLTQSEKKEIEYDILEVEADLKLASLG